MKKNTIFLSTIATIALLSSCTPSACDCYEHFSKGGISGTLTIDQTRACIDKYGDDIPDHWRGTNAFSNAMKDELRKECDSWKDYHNQSELKNMGY